MWRRAVGALSAVGLVSLVGYGVVSPGNSSRRLLANVVTADSADGGIIDVFENPREGFKQWMSNAGLDILDDDDVAAVHTKFLKRVLMMAHDVLPSSFMDQYQEDFAELGHIGLSATRPLTEAEANMKNYFGVQASVAPRASLRGDAKATRYWDFMPDDLGRAIPGGDELTFESKCWHKVTATTEQVSDGWDLHIAVSRAKDLIPYHCTDFYLLGTASQVSLGLFPTPVGGTKTYHFKTSKLSSSEQWDLENNGVRVMLFRDGPINVVQNLLGTALLFASELTKGVGDRVAARNLDFLERYAGVTMPERTDSGDLILDESEIQSGDFLGVIRFDGLDPVLAWAMGAHTGHTTVALWENDQLYIAESTAKGSYWPTNGLQRTPYRQWIDQAREAGFAVVHAPLAPKYRAMFDESAANAFFHSVDGIDYGYGALLVGWIDLATDNFPCLPTEIQSTPSCLLPAHIEFCCQLQPNLSQQLSLFSSRHGISASLGMLQVICLQPRFFNRPNQREWHTKTSSPLWKRTAICIPTISTMALWRWRLLWFAMCLCAMCGRQLDSSRRSTMISIAESKPTTMSTTWTFWHSLKSVQPHVLQPTQTTSFVSLLASTR
jgi:hypothetical protein